MTYRGTQFYRVVSRKLSHSNRLDRQIREGVRVRFAPSPTGSLHLGGLRTALYNYIFAKQHRGSFILRIEDTDQKRLVPGSADLIEQHLNWAGLRPDESPTLGGPCGPYMQSARLNLYQEKAWELLERGKAYYCFCSSERLDLLRKNQSRNREKPHYDGKCKNLSPSEVKDKLAQNINCTIRFAIQPGVTIVDDVVYGKVSNDLVTSKEGDPIIMKSDNFPTYHFANIVDDHLMKITHVLRGSEWLSSTCKHIQMYQAFDWQTPQYIHLPLISMSDGAKISKRNNQFQLETLVSAGYRPLALLNFLLNSGGGVPKSKQDSMELWSLEKLIESFKFSELTSHPASLDLDRLRTYNSREILQIWNEDPDKIVSEFRSLLESHQISSKTNNDQLKAAMRPFIERITTLLDLLAPDFAFAWACPKPSWDANPYLKKGWKPETIITDLLNQIESASVNNKETFDQLMTSVADKNSISKSDLYQFIRVVLSNNKSGIPVYEIHQCLGKTRFIEYLKSGQRYIMN